MRDYGKVHTTFWSSSSIRELSEDGRTLAIYLLTCPHGTIAGAFRLPDGYASEDLQWSSERVREGFQELFRNGFATRCEATKWVWVFKHFEWNPPENPNQRKAAAKVAAQIPDSCCWKPVFMRDCAVFMGLEATEKANPCETLPEPFRNQEQEQEQEVNPSNPDGLLVASKPATPACPHQEIIAAYHEILPACPAVRQWTPAREKFLRSRWAEDPKRQRVEWWRRFFAYVADSEFLTGRGACAPGRDPFVADLEWLVRPANFVKVIEGRYHPERSAA